MRIRDFTTGESLHPRRPQSRIPGCAAQIKIAKDLAVNDRLALITLLTDYQDLFAWSYSDMKGLDPQYYQHQIHLHTDAWPVQQRCYRMNPNYTARVKEEIDKLLRVGFIRPVKRATWLSPIVVVPKKNGQIRVCVDYWKLNAATITDTFPLPFTDSILDTVAGHNYYSFLDGFRTGSTAIIKSACTWTIKRKRPSSWNGECS